LLLFFGYFGGRNSMSRGLLLWGAPLSFLVQARPAKLLFKQLFYILLNPPGIVLSLLPAPQQTMLSIDIDKAYQTLYQTKEEAKKQKAQQAAAAAAAPVTTTKSKYLDRSVDDENKDDDDDDDDKEEEEMEQEQEEGQEEVVEEDDSYDEESDEDQD
jgi:hypothetical protein